MRKYMDTPNIAVIEYQKRTSHSEFLRWARTLEDTNKEYEETPEDDPKRVYLRTFSEECQLMTEHYKSISDMQDKLLQVLRNKSS
jgi:hypothetical protein